MCIRDSVRTGVSTTIQYAEAGPPEATSAVLLIHGWGESWRVWQSTLLSMSESGLSKRVIAVDLRGFGGSSPPARLKDSHSVGHHMDDMVGLMNALGLDRVSVVSHSTSAVVALKMATEYPHRVASLLLVSGAASFDANEQLAEWGISLEQLSEPGSAAQADTEPVTMDFVNSFFDSRFGHETVMPERLLETLQFELRRVARSVLRKNLESAMKQNFESELYSLAMPVTLVRGSEDSVVSQEEQAAMLKAIPHATVRAIDGGAHMLPVEKPDWLARILQAYAYVNEEHFAIGGDAIVGDHLQAQLQLGNLSKDCFLANSARP
eukprot:TRINITY_DN2110_c0_g1_i1.p1 TRINITY_DN2110_c0_g1~~TRINITY_DN2110_c0_g1_i1.p1  ORF type:complete len:322 (+),score=88.88 TRINITY_DN2110_c0_g1_i1:85-1050(+)